MSLQAINNDCWGAVSGLRVTNATGTFTYSPVYSRETYPSNPTRTGTTFRVVFNRPSSGNFYTPNMEPVTVTFTLNNRCNKARFFNTGSGFSGARSSTFPPARPRRTLPFRNSITAAGRDPTKE